MNELLQVPNHLFQDYDRDKFFSVEQEFDFINVRFVVNCCMSGQYF